MNQTSMTMYLRVRKCALVFVRMLKLFREKINLKLKSTTVRCQRLSANTRMYNTKSVGMSKNNVFVYDKNDKDFLNYAVILKKVSDD